MTRFERKAAGDAFHPFSAAAYNAMIEAAAARALEGDPRVAPPPTGPGRSTAVVLVRNGSGADQDRYDVLGVDGVVITPAEEQSEFERRIALEGVVPAWEDHQHRFVVLLEPIPYTGFGLALAQGVVQCRVNIRDGSHTCAGLADGQTGYLESGGGGPARILYKPAGLGSQLCVVAIGTGRDPLRWGRIVVSEGTPQLWDSQTNLWTDYETDEEFCAFALVNPRDPVTDETDTTRELLVAFLPALNPNLFAGEPLPGAMPRGEWLGPISLNTIDGALCYLPWRGGHVGGNIDRYIAGVDAGIYQALPLVFQRMGAGTGPTSWDTPWAAHDIRTYLTGLGLGNLTTLPVHCRNIQRDKAGRNQYEQHPYEDYEITATDSVGGQVTFHVSGGPSNPSP